jgi:hypothetical protein
VPGPEGSPGTQLPHDRTVSPAASTGSVEPTGDLVGVEAEAAANLQVGDPPLGHESPHVALAGLEGGGQLLEGEQAGKRVDVGHGRLRTGELGSRPERSDRRATPTVT